MLSTLHSQGTASSPYAKRMHRTDIVLWSNKAKTDILVQLHAASHIYHSSVFSPFFFHFFFVQVSFFFFMFSFWMGSGYNARSSQCRMSPNPLHNGIWMHTLVLTQTCRVWGPIQANLLVSCPAMAVPLVWLQQPKPTIAIDGMLKINHSYLYHSLWTRPSGNSEWGCER